MQPTEQEALVVENQLIRELTPSYNVDGKYSFLYPAIGVRRRARHTLFCFTTNIERWAAYEFRWFGTLRSRPRAKEAFDALVELLALLGHLERTSTLGKVPRAMGSRLVGVRQLSAGLVAAVEEFLSGATRDGLIRVSSALLEKPRARRDAAVVQQRIHLLAEFYDADLRPLHAALRSASRSGTFVPQEEARHALHSPPSLTGGRSICSCKALQRSGCPSPTFGPTAHLLIHEPLLDPMCGSGALPIEAALWAQALPPGGNRRFGFERWRCFDDSAVASWELERQRARDLAEPVATRISGSDRDAQVLKMARANAGRAAVTVDFKHAALADLPAQESGTLIVTNPPYGVRLTTDERWNRDFARFLGRMRTCAVVAITPNRSLAREVDIAPAREHTLFNGDLECRLFSWDVR